MVSRNQQSIGPGSWWKLRALGSEDSEKLPGGYRISLIDVVHPATTKKLSCKALTYLVVITTHYNS